MTKKIIEKSAWIYIKNNRVLSTRSFNKEKFYFPGGKPEPNESKEATLIREIKEELSVTLISESIKYLGTFEAQADSQAKEVLVKMDCFTAEYEGTLSIASEIEELDWLSYQEREKSSMVDRIIFDWLLKKNYIR